MIKNLFWFSLIVLLISACAIGWGGFVLLKWGLDIGLAYTYGGFMGLAVSGLAMTLAYEIP